MSYEGEERRNKPRVEETLEAVEEQLKVIDGQLSALFKQVDTYLGAFPVTASGAPDTAGHRSYHEELIAAVRARRDFYSKLLFELVKLGLAGFVFWLAIQAWQGFLKGPQP